MSSIVNLILALVIAVGAFLAVQGAFVLVNYFSFQQNFLEELTKKDIAKSGLGEALVKSSLARGLIFFLGSTALCLVLAAVTWPGGIVAYIVVTAISLAFFRPVKAMYTRSSFNIAGFLSKYGDYLNTDKFKTEYAKELADSKVNYTE